MLSSYQNPHSGYQPQKDDSHTSTNSSMSGAASELQIKHNYRDLWASLLFWVQAITLLTIGFICYRRHSNEFAPSDPDSHNRSHRDDVGPLEHALPLIGACLCFGGGMAMLALYLMQNHPVILIWTSLIFTLIMSGLVVLLALLVGDVIGIVICALLFVLTLWYIYSIRHRIPFAAAMLDVSLRSMKMFPTSWLIPIFGIVLMAVVSYLWSIASFSIVYAVDNGGDDAVRNFRGLIFFALVLSTFWTALVIRGWVHTSIAGVQATWYFLVPLATPAHPVGGAIKRASTTSFGSICFGSLLVAFIRTLRFFVNIAYQNARESQNQLAACALCILECFMSCLEGMVNYINQYAFAICAIYGSAFIDSATKALQLMRSRGYDAIVNDSLVGGVLSLCMIVGGLSTGIVGGLLAYFLFDTDWRIYGGIGFVIGFLMLMVVAEVVESAIIALFICFADDPVTLQRTKPDEYHRLTEPLSVYYPNRGISYRNPV